MDDPALCLRACSRLWMSDWEYPHSAEVWSSVFRHNGAQNTFLKNGWIHFRMSSDALPLWFKMVCHMLSKLDSVVTPFLCWWSLRKAYWACYILHMCAIHYWEMARSVPNWSCPKWEHENITVPFLFNPHMSCDRRNQPCSKPLLAMPPHPLPPTAAPDTPGECCPPQPFSVTGRCLQLKFWVWLVIQRFTHWHFLSISKLLVLQKNWQWSACLK